MNEIEVINKKSKEIDIVEIVNGKPMTTSIMIADTFGKEHYNLLSKIKEIECNFTALNFKVSDYTDASGRKLPMYLLDRDFTTFLIMGFTGKKAIEWKLKYIDAFNKMEQQLLKQNTTLLPQNYKEALQQLLLQVEENEKLLEQNSTLQLDVKCLSGEILEWGDRSLLNAGIRKLSSVSNIFFATLWNELYTELKYKYHIDVKARGKKDYIQFIKENEWELALKSFSALCTKYNQSPSDMLRDKRKEIA